MNTEIPQWVLIFERIGPGSAFLVFTMAVIWKVLPAVQGLLAAWRTQSEVLTGAIPRVESAFERLIDKLDRIGDNMATVHFERNADKKTVDTM